MTRMHRLVRMRRPAALQRPVILVTTRSLAFPFMAAAVAIWAAFQDLHRLAQPFVLFDERTYANAAWRY
jgi:hypothetical protein